MKKRMKQCLEELIKKAKTGKINCRLSVCHSMVEDLRKFGFEVKVPKNTNCNDFFTVTISWENSKPESIAYHLYNEVKKCNIRKNGKERCNKISRKRKSKRNRTSTIISGWTRFYVKHEDLIFLSDKIR